MERLELTAAPGDSGRLDAWLAGAVPDAVPQCAAKS